VASAVTNVMRESRRLRSRDALANEGHKPANNAQKPNADCMSSLSSATIERVHGSMVLFMDTVDQAGLEVAIEEARAGLAEGGIPIGSALMIDGEIVGRGHNRRVQEGSVVLHAEMDCLERTGRLPGADYRRATLYTTLSPCDMCTGAALLYGIPRVVIGENETFLGGEALLESRGVELVHADDHTCKQLMSDFIAAEPELWNEDIGE
jgi:creatinine deaminase